MKCVITGYERGIGKDFYNYFIRHNWEVIGLNKDSIDSFQGECDLFINNAYANGNQIRYAKEFIYHKMIVCGSVASDTPDPKLPKYSKDKRDLEDYIKQLQSIKPSTILLLKLSGHAYNNIQMLLDIIELWLIYPSIEVISFAHGERNSPPTNSIQ